jgi:hypothetical protein
MKRWAFLVALTATACVNEPMTYRDLDRLARDNQREAISRPPPDTCQMSAYQGLIGRDGASIDQTALPSGARVICHECPVTLEFRAERLNVQLGPDGKVASLRCG